MKLFTVTPRLPELDSIHNIRPARLGGVVFNPRPVPNDGANATDPHHPINLKRLGRETSRHIE